MKPLLAIIAAAALSSCSIGSIDPDLRGAAFVGKRQAFGLEFALGQYAVGAAITARKLPEGEMVEGDPPYSDK